jgi:chemotaxis protein methyltransferase CheR
MQKAENAKKAEVIMAHKISDDDFKRLVTYMEQHFGINLKQKRILIEGRLNATIQQRGFPDFKSFLDMAFNDRTGTEMINLINKLTTNHTFFYREKEHYEFMVQTALPYFEKEKKDHKLSVWSAACSSGEEPYTNVMQILDYFGTKSAAWKIDLLATDISDKVMEMAKTAIYHKDSMKEIPETWKKKYFIPQPNDCFKVSPVVTSHVQIKKFNLMEPIPFKSYPFDIIFCRNVMIYFENEVKMALVNRFYDVLAPGGYLFIGHAESITRDASKYQYVKPAIYRKPLDASKPKTSLAAAITLAQQEAAAKRTAAVRPAAATTARPAATATAAARPVSSAATRSTTTTTTARPAATVRPSFTRTTTGTTGTGKK